MPTAYILVGVPGAGKTTWYREQCWLADAVYISTDKHVEGYAASTNRTYSEVFEGYMPTAVTLMVEEVKRAKEERKDIVWDQTSTTIRSRAKKFAMLWPDYRMVAVVFRTPDQVELERRLNSRPGKVIPITVMSAMVHTMEDIDGEEHFDEVWRV